MIPIAKPILGEQEIKAIKEVIESGIIAQGPKVEEFEKKFANYIGTKHAIAVNSGTAALHIAVTSLEVKKVAVPAFSFVASASAVIHANANPVFTDVQENDFCIDLSQVENVDAIMPVHLFGQSCNMDELITLDIPIIEDACQSHGAEYKNKKVGSFGTGCFSFYPTKNMTSIEGGMITTNDDRIAEKCKMLRAHGSKEKYKHEIIGYNMRMTDISAAIALVQLEQLDKWNQQRIDNAIYLTKNINNPLIKLPETKPDCKHVFNQYTIKTLYRDKLQQHLTEKEVGSAIYYPIPLHKQPIFNNPENKQTSISSSLSKLKVSESICQQVLSIPVHPSLTKEDLEHIVNSLNEFKI